MCRWGRWRPPWCSRSSRRCWTPLPQLEWLHPWLFSHYWLDFADLLRQPVAWDSFATNALLQGGYIAVFGALAYGRFVTKDVLS